MAKKCVHKGCGKTYADADEECVYHPGPPVFHEGQKGADPGGAATQTPQADMRAQAGSAASPVC